MSKRLSDFLSIEHQQDSPITNCGIRLSEFRQDVQTAMNFLHESGTSTRSIALYSTDSYFFLVNLMAAWQLNKHVVIPGECHADIEAKLAMCDLIGDFSQSLCRELLPGSIFSDIQFKKLEDTFNAITVYTSGSTGQPDKISKTIGQLEREILALQSNFSEYITPGNTQVLSTVSHQHFYGLPFRLLWPICSGARIARRQIIFSGEWSDIRYQHILISSPVFLKRAVQSGNLSKLKDKVLVIYSAGGQLAFEIQRELQQQLKAQVIEVYGSSETGSVAWRKYPQTDWSLQPNVQIALNDAGLLKIKSPFLPDQAWFQTQDRALLTGCSFQLLGRADNIVKIEEKRISLTCIEQTLCRLPWVEDCKALVLQLPTRTRIGMIVKLSDMGIAQLQDDQRWRFCQRLRAAISPYLDAIALPRSWRFVAHIPTNSMGKTTQADLAKLFSKQLKRPLVVQLNKLATNTYRLLLDINRNLACLNGHFPDWLVLPGVAQIEWAIAFAKANGFQGQCFSRLEVVKFQNPIIPNKLIALELIWDNAERLVFKYFDEQMSYSGGRIFFV